MADFPRIWYKGWVGTYWWIMGLCTHCMILAWLLYIFVRKSDKAFGRFAFAWIFSNLFLEVVYLFTEKDSAQQLFLDGWLTLFWLLFYAMLLRGPTKRGIRKLAQKCAEIRHIVILRIGGTPAHPVSS